MKAKLILGSLSRRMLAVSLSAAMIITAVPAASVNARAMEGETGKVSVSDEEIVIESIDDLTDAVAESGNDAVTETAESAGDNVNDDEAASETDGDEADDASVIDAESGVADVTDANADETAASADTGESDDAALSVTDGDSAESLASAPDADAAETDDVDALLSDDAGTGGGTVTFSKSETGTSAILSDGASGITATTDKTGVTAVSITAVGEYTLTGEAVNAYVTIAEGLTDGVTLNLNGLTLDDSGLCATAGKDLPVIAVKKSGSVVNFVLTGTSSLTGSSSFVKEPDAVIKAPASTISFLGSGTLNVEDGMPTNTDFKYNGESVDPADGISAKEGTINFISGTVNVTFANGSAVKAKTGTINVRGGILNTSNTYDDAVKAKDGTINVTSGEVNVSRSYGDGLKAKMEDTADGGNVNISGGKVNVTDEIYGDGIQAENVNISRGQVNITTTYENASTQYYVSGSNVSGYNTIVENGSTKTERVNVDTGSHKGIKAGTKAATKSYGDGTASTTTTASGGIRISGGTINIDTTAAGLKANSVSTSGYAATSSGKYIIGSPDDAIHSNNDIYVTGGTINVASSDDGIGAAGSLYVINSATVNVTQAFEGIEAGNVIIGTSGQENGPTITLNTVDDGINASSKTVSYVYDSANDEDCNYVKTSTSGNDNTCVIYGGTLTVKIDSENSHSVILGGEKITYGADGDGIDCNGTLDIEGGNVYVFGQSSGDNAPLDHDTGFTLSGKATVLAVGSGSMASESLPGYGDGVYVSTGASGGMGPGANQPGSGFNGIGAMNSSSVEQSFTSDDGTAETDSSEDGTSVTAEGAGPGGNQPGGNQPGGNQPGGNQPGGNQPGSAASAISFSAEDTLYVKNGNDVIISEKLPFAASFAMFASSGLTSGASYVITNGTGGVTVTAQSPSSASNPNQKTVSPLDDEDSADNGDGGASSGESGTDAGTSSGESGTDAGTSSGESGTDDGSETNVVAEELTEDVASGQDNEVQTTGDESDAAAGETNKKYAVQMVKGQSYVFGAGIWTSSDKSVVSVAAKTGKATVKKAGTATLTDSKNKRTYEITAYEPKLSLSKLTMLNGTTDAESLSIGNTGKLPVSWISSNACVASVTGDKYAVNDESAAMISAIGTGSAKVTAYVGGRAYSATVTVKAITNPVSLSASDEVTLNAFQTYVPKFSTGFKASGATWTGGDDTQVSQDEGTKAWIAKDNAGNDVISISKAGRITALKSGTVMLKGVDANDRDAELTVTVKAVPTRTDVYLNVGQKISYKNLYVKNNGVAWTLSEGGDQYVTLAGTDKAKISITGSSAGTTVLTCSYAGETYETSIHVEDPSVSLSTSGRTLVQPEDTAYYYTLNLKQGDVVKLVQTGVDQTVNWKTSARAKAFVSEYGLIYARAKGTAVVSAKVNNKTVKVKVTVE